PRPPRPLVAQPGEIEGARARDGCPRPNTGALQVAPGPGLGAAVIDQHHLEVAVRAPPQAAQAAAQEPQLVPERDHDAHPATGYGGLVEAPGGHVTQLARAGAGPARVVHRAGAALQPAEPRPERPQPATAQLGHLLLQPLRPLPLLVVALVEQVDQLPIAV